MGEGSVEKFDISDECVMYARTCSTVKFRRAERHTVM